MICRQPERAGVRARHHVRLQRPGGRPPQLCAHAGRGVPRHRGRDARPAAAGGWGRRAACTHLHHLTIALKPQLL